MGLLSFMLTRGGPIALIVAAEHYFTASAVVPLLSQGVALAVPRLYGLVILINFVASSFVLVYLGFNVGSARSKFVEEAKKKGDDKDAEVSP